VLCLHLSKDKKLLFSSAGDAMVKVWDAVNLTPLYIIYSTFDIGDVFSVVYSNDLQTIYLGAQNTSIQVTSLPIPPETASRSPLIVVVRSQEHSGPSPYILLVVSRAPFQQILRHKPNTKLPRPIRRRRRRLNRTYPPPRNRTTLPNPLRALRLRIHSSPRHAPSLLHRTPLLRWRRRRSENMGSRHVVETFAFCGR